MSRAPLLKAMDSMISVLENTKITMSGKCSPIFLTIFHLQQSSKVKFLVLTADSPLLLPPLMTSESSIDSRKSHMKVPFVIFCGAIPMKDSVSMSVQEVQAGLSAK